LSRLIFGVILGIIGLLYLWLAFQAVLPGIAGGDWVSYLGGLLFLAAGAAAAFAAVNLIRPKRR
jgi:hypothetical protein